MSAIPENHQLHRKIQNITYECKRLMTHGVFFDLSFVFFLLFPFNINIPFNPVLIASRNGSYYENTLIYPIWNLGIILCIFYAIEIEQDHFGK